MGWNPPDSYAVSEIVTAAKLNLNVRDNLNYLKGNAGAVAISDEIASIVAAGGSISAEGTSNGSFARYKMLCKSAGGAVIDWRFLANGAGASEFGIFESASERLRIMPGGNVGINYTAPQGKLHVGGVGGCGMVYLSATGVNNTLQTLAIAGTVAATAYFFAVLDYASTGGASVVSGQPLKINAGASNTYTNGDTITIAVTAGGAITIQRTAGAASNHDVSLMVVYK